MAKEVEGFYTENTVEIEFKGKKRRVNKFEAEYLKKKIAKAEKKK